MLEVTAKAEQIPNICSAMGLLVTTGSNSVFLMLAIMLLLTLNNRSAAQSPLYLANTAPNC